MFENNSYRKLSAT